MHTILALIVLGAAAGPAAAQSALQKCKSIADSLERLRCYDAIEAEPAATSPQPAAPAATSAQPAKPAASPAQAAAPPAPAEDPLIAQAKAAVTAQLRNPGSARFRDVKLRTVAGKQAVCGLVNARNSRGFMTGPQPFAYDGEQAYLIVFNPGPANFTSLDANSLIAAMGGRLRSYNRLCR